MGERILNGLLAVQVMASVALTGVLMYRPPLAIQPADPLRVVAPPLLAPATPPDLYLPRAVWVHPGGGRYVSVGPVEPLYQLAWKQMRLLLVRGIAHPGGWERATPLELAQAAAQPLVGADLPLALPAGELARLWEAVENPAALVSRAAQPEGREGPVDRVVLTLTPPGAIYLVGTRSIVRLSLSDPEREELAQLVRAIDPRSYPNARLLSVLHSEPLSPGEDDPLGQIARDEFAPWLLVPAGAVSAASPLILPQPPDPQVHLPRFFPDSSVVRQIQEQDGSVVYTDGRRGMRIYLHGALEYIESHGGAEGNGPDLAAALHLAQEFISARNLWPPGATLTSFSRFGQEAWLTFGVRGPLLPWVSVRPLLEVRVAGDRVVYLYRSPDYTTVASSGNDQLVTPEQALQQIKIAIGGRRLRVRSMHLAHRVEPSGLQVLVPVWHVLLQDGDIYMVDARSGRVLR